MTKQVKTTEKAIRSNIEQGIFGEAGNTVDYIMYFSILFVIGFGVMAYKKLAEQKDHLVI